MITFKIERQVGRAGMPPTLPVAVAGEGNALEQMHDEKPSNIGENYADYEGSTLLYFFSNHVIYHHLRGASSPALSRDVSLSLKSYHGCCQSTKRRTFSLTDDVPRVDTPRSVLYTTTAEARLLE